MSAPCATSTPFAWALPLAPSLMFSLSMKAPTIDRSRSVPVDPPSVSCTIRACAWEVPPVRIRPA